jgi:hypothetical protein
MPSPYSQLPQEVIVNRTVQLILIIVLVLLLIGLLPMWPYSTGWGYFPSGGLGLLLIIVILIVALGSPKGPVV